MQEFCCTFVTARVSDLARIAAGLRQKLLRLGARKPTHTLRAAYWTTVQSTAAKGIT
jgi:hypothetical protein